MTKLKILLLSALLFPLISFAGGTLQYVALLNQSETGQPVATVLKNTIGDIVWTRSSEGVMSGVLLGAFPEGRTWLYIDPSKDGDSEIGHQVSVKRLNDNVIRINTGNPDHADDCLVNASVEIRVYDIPE